MQWKPLLGGAVTSGSKELNMLSMYYAIGGIYLDIGNLCAGPIMLVYFPPVGSLLEDSFTTLERLVRQRYSLSDAYS